MSQLTIKNCTVVNEGDLIQTDLLIKNGTLIDPAQGIHASKDVAFAQGAVAAVGDDLPAAEAREVIDAHDAVKVGQMSDVSGQMSDVSGRISDVGGQMSDVSGQMSV